MVADLTDPLLSADEACGIFEVLLGQFTRKSCGTVGKVVVFDEAHKYLHNSGPGCAGLQNAIVETVRQMRHKSIRVLISTQSPLTMPPELLELASVTILHQFQSSDWCTYLAGKVTLPHNGFEQIKRLKPGQALVLSAKIGLNGSGAAQDIEENGDSYDDDDNDQQVKVSCLKLNIRKRLTEDLGASRSNQKKD